MMSPTIFIFLSLCIGAHAFTTTTATAPAAEQKLEPVQLCVIPDGACNCAGDSMTEERMFLSYKRLPPQEGEEKQQTKPYLFAVDYDGPKTIDGLKDLSEAGTAFNSIEKTNNIMWEILGAGHGGKGVAAGQDKFFTEFESEFDQKYDYYYSDYNTINEYTGCKGIEILGDPDKKGYAHVIQQYALIGGSDCLISDRNNEPGDFDYKTSVISSDGLTITFDEENHKTSFENGEGDWTHEYHTVSTIFTRKEHETCFTGTWDDGVYKLKGLIDARWPMNGRTTTVNTCTISSECGDDTYCCCAEEDPRDNYCEDCEACEEDDDDVSEAKNPNPGSCSEKCKDTSSNAN